eukprot:4307246-Prymnesium_polylepis.1
MYSWTRCSTLEYERVVRGNLPKSPSELIGKSFVIEGCQSTATKLFAIFSYMAHPHMIHSSKRNFGIAARSQNRTQTSASVAPQLPLSRRP